MSTLSSTRVGQKETKKSRSPYKKLSDADVIQAITLHNQGMNNMQIGKLLGCHNSNISKIVTGVRKSKAAAILNVVVQKVSKMKVNDDLEKVIEKIRKRSTFQLEGKHMLWDSIDPNHMTPQIFYKGKNRKVVDLVYEFYFNTVIKKNQRVNLNCDNKLCVNSEHLVLITKKGLNKNKKAGV